jgi:TPR repeat protein
MINTEALFRIGDAAEDAGDYERARQAFEKGAALGDVSCLNRLAYLFDVGIGVEVDKAFAMRCYQRAWRRGRCYVAANNIAVLYRESGNLKAMFQWFERAAEQGDEDALVELAKCYLDGLGVRRSIDQALRRLAAAASKPNLFEASREEVGALLAEFRPKVIAGNGK